MEKVKNYEQYDSKEYMKIINNWLYSKSAVALALVNESTSTKEDGKQEKKLSARFSARVFLVHI